jgi:hypothetical protein
MTMFAIMKDCNGCGSVSEERVFTDSWTGLQLCMECVSAVAPHVTMSPATDGDNLRHELKERVG